MKRKLELAKTVHNNGSFCNTEADKIEKISVTGQ